MEKYIGLDIHRKFVQACVLDAEGDVQEQRRLELTDPDQVIEFFNDFEAESSEVVMEATIGWMWLADVLEEQHFPVHLAHMAGCKVIAESRCKTDKVDARTLAELLRVNFLPEAYLAPRELREMRMILRHREGLCEGGSQDGSHHLADAHRRTSVPHGNASNPGRLDRRYEGRRLHLSVARFVCVSE